MGAFGPAVDGRSMSVYMAGSEWFDTRAGGLNRYFEDLFTALASSDALDVFAFAFGDPPHGGSTWGPASGSTLQRVMRSRNGPSWRPGMVLDRHFSLYGARPSRGLQKAPMLVHFQGPWAGESAIAGETEIRVRLKRAFEKMRYRDASAFVVLSNEFKDLLANDYDVDPGKISVVPPGVDLARFRVAPGSSDQPHVLCVRRLERRMGIHVLLDAWLQVVSVVPEARLSIVGTGHEELNLREQVDRLGLSGFVDFRGRLSDASLANLYQDSMLTVVPSTTLEGFGLIALESLATGTPPVVTNCGGLPDAVMGLDSSLIVESNNQDQLAERIISAIRGQRPSAEACRRHAETFAWSEVAHKHEALYRSIQ